MSKNVKFGLIGLGVLITCIWFYFSPHFSAYNMKKAAESKDADALSGYVDYPSLRESLKANFNAKMASEVTKRQTGNPYEALGVAFATALINPMVDAFVTPESLAMLMKGDNPMANKTSADSSDNTKSDKSTVETSMSYKGLNSFVVTVYDKDKNEAPVEFIFMRDGIISWKLSALHLPL